MKKRRDIVLRLDPNTYKRFDQIRRRAGHTTWKSAVTGMIAHAVKCGSMVKKKTLAARED